MALKKKHISKKQRHSHPKLKLKKRSKSSKNKSPIQTQKNLPLSQKDILKIYHLMVRSRALEERLIKIYKSGKAYFWIGGPGEEAFGVPLGLLIKKGKGLQHDWLHFHYRATPTLVAMGMEPEDSFRLIMNKATDPFNRGEKFCKPLLFS